jgi:GDP-L-fucose synthase
MRRRLHEAKMAVAPDVTLWGTGTPRREFLNVDDFADACVHLMRVHNGDELANVGIGEVLSMSELAHLMTDVIGYRGTLRFDATKPHGTPRKQLDVSSLAAKGWRWSMPRRDGIAATSRWHLANGPKTVGAAR